MEYSKLKKGIWKLIENVTPYFLRIDWSHSLKKKINKMFCICKLERTVPFNSVKKSVQRVWWVGMRGNWRSGGFLLDDLLGDIIYKYLLCIYIQKRELGGEEIAVRLLILYLKDFQSIWRQIMSFHLDRVVRNVLPWFQIRITNILLKIQLNISMLSNNWEKWNFFRVCCTVIVTQTLQNKLRWPICRRENQILF